ncbi:MAG: transcription elongation factor [Cereibacter sphaeroides]|uniref:Transcription elongation factor n=1 Tax=Cereibacter sphaeroides TaxID=1063 RepID=A0A2W5SIM4_CERSP|nr:MAG: transcription elongation factor [Cereibacter sphaeroides]
MSRAFVKEGTGELDPLPDLPISPHPNYVTPRGLAQLQSRLAETQARLATLRSRAERLDRLPEAAAERDIRYLEARLRSAIPVSPPPNPQEAAFATRVTVIDEDGREQHFEITGEDEADAATGRIAPQSPLARALIGARVGDTVVWSRPAGKAELEVLAIGASTTP